MVESIPTITTFWKGERQWQQKKLTKLWLVKKKKKNFSDYDLVLYCMFVFWQFYFKLKWSCEVNLKTITSPGCTVADLSSSDHWGAPIKHASSNW